MLKIGTVAFLGVLLAIPLFRGIERERPEVRADFSDLEAKVQQIESLEKQLKPGQQIVIAPEHGSGDRLIIVSDGKGGTRVYIEPAGSDTAKRVERVD